MSYARKHRVRTRYANVRGHRVALGDISSDMQAACSDPDYYNSITGLYCRAAFPDGPPQPTSQTQQCIIDSATLTDPLDAKIADLARNWQPTGFYSASDMLTITGAVQTLLSNAESMCEQVVADPAGNVKMAQDELFRHMAQNRTYTVAAGQAGGKPINAPGLKDFVINAMNSASAALTAAYVVSCQTPWWASALVAFQNAFDAVWNVAKRIVGLVIAAGSAVLTVAEETTSILKYVPYAAAAVGAYILIVELGRYKKRRS